jgi:hypothetical protein
MRPLLFCAILALTWLPAELAAQQTVAFDSVAVGSMQTDISECEVPLGSCPRELVSRYEAPLFKAGATQPTLSITLNPPQRHYTLWGAIIGGIAGGGAFMLWQRATQGPCDDRDSFIPCEAGYAMLFGVGAVPGAVLGAIIGHSISR